MIFSAPVPFREALKSRQVKKIMPTNLNTAGLMKLETAVRERSTFSARVWQEDLLRGIADNVVSLINPQQVERGGRLVTEGPNPATVRLRLKEILKSIGYSPEPDKRGTIEDLSSDQRLNLIIKTNVEMAQGYGYWAQGQDPDVLDQWPAFELFRAEDRKEPRDWQVRWLNAAGQVGDDAAAAALRRHGRMAALKDSPLWEALSAFGQPYPPFDFNSGMDLQDVDRDDAVALGLIDRDTQVKPQSRGFEMEEAA